MYKKLLINVYCIEYMPQIHRSKGRAQLIFYVQPSKNKLDCFRNKKYLLTFTYCFLLTQPSSNQIICFDFEKTHYLKIFYTPWLLLPACPGIGEKQINNSDCHKDVCCSNGDIFSGIFYLPFFSDKMIKVAIFDRKMIWPYLNVGENSTFCCHCP